jgi:hypothetical protein
MVAMLDNGGLGANSSIDRTPILFGSELGSAGNSKS